MPFSVLVPDVEELESGDPLEVARENARRKADAVPAEAAEGATVLAVDTVVALDGEVYGKPRDAEHATAMLGALSDREHRVIAGWRCATQAGRSSPTPPRRCVSATCKRCCSGTWRPASGAIGPAATPSRPVAPRW